MISKEIKDYISNRENFELKQATDLAVSNILHTSRNALIDLILENPSRFQIPATVKLVPRKLNKGNNHLGFPYIVSDFPCYFSVDHVFSFRILVWYGNSISISLLLSGRFKENYTLPEQAILKHNYTIESSANLWKKNEDLGARFLGDDSEEPTKQEENNALRIQRAFDIELISNLPEITKTCFVDLLQSK